jgi:hypothetical protein
VVTANRGVEHRRFVSLLKLRETDADVEYKFSWDRPSKRVVGALIATKLAVHLALVGRYGHHGDELYFLECGRHLAFGYVDHAPLIPWLARAAEEAGGISLLTLRIPAIAAGAGTMWLAALLVRDWGGGWRAQLVTLLSLLLAPAYLRMGAMLNIPAIEVFLCTAVGYLVLRALRRVERWTWPTVGVVAGLALLAKHTVLLWAACFAVGLLVTEHRRALRTPGPWIALAIAVLLFAPNLAWQVAHDFATFEFSSNLRRGILEEQGRLLFLLGQVLYFHPLVVPVWIAGLVFAFRDRGRAARPFAVLFLAMLAALFVLGGKPYYLGSAYPPVLAAGGIALERWHAKRARAWYALTLSIAVVGLPLALLTLPIFPIRSVDAALQRILGWVVPPIALTHDMHGEHGWEEHVATIQRVLDALPPEDRAQSSVLTGSYSQAAALNVLRADPVPRAISGHMSYYEWGPEPARGSVLIAYGLPRELLVRYYADVEERARIVASLARPQDTDLSVYVCRRPRGDMSTFWPAVRRFGHAVGGSTER